MTARTLGSKKSRGSFRGKGWDAIQPPIPGNVFACMEELGIENVRQKEDEIEGKCPMHFERLGKEDKHSSWSVNADEGYFNCFSCGYKGPFCLLVKDMLKISWEDAASWIRTRGSIERAKRILGHGYIDDIVKRGPEDTTKVITEANLALYVEPPLWACDERELDPAMVDEMGILWDAENDRWILPIRNPDTGKLMGWQEKGKGYFRNRPRSLAKSTTLFGIDTFDDSHGYAVLVESPLDTVRVNTAMEQRVSLGSMGAAVSDAQMELIIDRVDTLIVALDNPWVDRAGAKAMEDLRLRYRGRGLTMKFFDYEYAKGAKDPGDGMTDDQIRWAIETSYSSVLARFK